jgi:anti-sigma factor RsiW
MSGRGLTCRQVVDFLDRFVGGELPAPETERFQAHLRACPECVDYLRSYRETIRLSASAWADAESLPADVPPRLVEGILAAVKSAR